MFESPELLLVAVGALLIGVCVTVLVMELLGLRGKTVLRLVEKIEGEAPPPELLHIELSKQTGKPVVRVQGQPVLTVDAIDDPHLRSQVRTLLHTLAPASMLPPQAGNVATTPAPIVPRGTTEPTATDALPASESDAATVPTLHEPLSGSFFSRLRDSLQKPAYVTGPAIPLPSLRPAKPAPEKSSAAPTDMFASINVILQRKLRGHPELPVVEILSGVDSLQIRMNEQIYRSIADVPDATIQQIIRAAIDEWDS